MEIIEKENRKVKVRNTGKKKKEKLCCYFVRPLSFYLSGLVGPNRSIKYPASIAIRVTEVLNPPTTKR